MRVILDEGAFLPKRAYRFDAGLDIFSPVEAYVPPHGSVEIDTGVHVELEEHTVGLLKSKSGLMCKHEITSEGVIDCGFTGSIRVKLFNHSSVGYHVSAGDKISQLIVLPVCLPVCEEVDSLGKTERGDRGFGSTGV